MEKIVGIDGLTTEVVNNYLVVKYLGQKCPLISRKEILCKQDTSYRGCVLDEWCTYRTPIGIVESHYWARGGGLEMHRTDWRIVPVEEIQEVQERFEKASVEMEAARAALEMVCGKR